jgi:hypothetical protein
MMGDGNVKVGLGIGSDSFFQAAQQGGNQRPTTWLSRFSQADMVGPVFGSSDSIQSIRFIASADLLG